MRAKLAGVCLFAVALALATGAPASGQEGTPTAITDIRQESDERSTRLVVECTGPLAYTYYSPDPLTLVVDVPEVDASRIPARINVGTHEVESLRVTSLARADGRNLARLEVRLASLVPYQIFTKGKDLTLVFERPAAQAAAPAPAPPAVPAAALSTPAPPEAAPATDTPAASGPPASKITAVTREETDGRLAFTVKADGRLKYQDFVLPNPDRVVLDFADVSARAAVRTMEVGQDPVRRVRLGQFSASSPKVARLVLDLTVKSPYRIIDGADGVRIVFGESGEGRPAAHAPLAALGAPAEAAEPTAAPAPAPITIVPTTPRPVTLEPLVLPALQEPQAPAPAEAAAVASPEAYGTACGQTGFLGTPISLDFKDGDLVDIFRLFADISGLNVVVNPGITGKVSLKLNEVPWGRALELILKTNGLGCVLEGDVEKPGAVIRIARLQDLQKEEADRRKLAEEQALAGDLEDMTRRISYAKANDLAEVLRKSGALSARGQMNVDERTNSILIRDLPAYLAKAKALMDELDSGTPQVEIEARIVITERGFARDLGIQWGFNQERSGRFGNTTGLSFPNSIIINGGAVTGGSRGTGLAADQGGQAVEAGIGRAGRGYAVNLPVPAFNTALGVSMGSIGGSFNLDLAISALEQQRRARLVSAPKVTTQNNHKAEIKQGQQIPFQTSANNTVTTQFKDVALVLSVTPQITDAGTVILDIMISNDSLGQETSQGPAINTQTATTQVLVRDGETTVIGGIFQSFEEKVSDRTPWLSSIPLLGYLFRNNSSTAENDELLVFVTPRIRKI